MKKHFITLTTGEKFPVEMSLGAMLLFKHETGKEATEADMGSLSDLTILLWGGQQRHRRCRVFRSSSLPSSSRTA